MLRKRTTGFLSGALVLCCVSVVVYGGLLYAMNRSKAVLTAERQEVATARDQAQKRSELARSQDQITSEQTELRSRFLVEEQIVDFLGSTEALGRAEGAIVSTASLEIVPVDGYFDELHITVKASGSLTAVQRVLTLLERLPYRSEVTSAMIGEKGVTEGEWEGTFALMVMKYKGP